jgi:hypothetical protein
MQCEPSACMKVVITYCRYDELVKHSSDSLTIFMFVILNIQRMRRTQPVYVGMFYLHAKFHTPS